MNKPTLEQARRPSLRDKQLKKHEATPATKEKVEITKTKTKV